MEQLEACKNFLAAARPEWSKVEAGSAGEGRVVAHVRAPGSPGHVAHVRLANEIDFLNVPRQAPPLFVCYYTQDTPYEALAGRLRASLDRCGLPHRIEGIPTRGSWVANTGLKADFIERVWHDADRPICWVDADAEMLSSPNFVYDNPFDFAVVRRHGWYDISSFVYFGKSQAAGKLISEWAQLCRNNPHIWDQALLTLAWYKTAQEQALSTLWLNDGIFRFPRPWLRDVRDRVFYYPSKRKIRPFVDQKQASRNLKSFMNASKRTEGELGSDDIGQAFRTALMRYEFNLAANVETLFDSDAD